MHEAEYLKLEGLKVELRQLRFGVRRWSACPKCDRKGKFGRYSRAEWVAEKMCYVCTWCKYEFALRKSVDLDYQVG